MSENQNEKLTKNEQKILMILWDIPLESESKYMGGVELESLSKATNLEKSKLQKILSKLEDERYIEHRIFHDGGDDYSIEQKGIDFCKKISKKRINVPLLKLKAYKESLIGGEK